MAFFHQLGPDGQYFCNRTIPMTGFSRSWSVNS